MVAHGQGIGVAQHDHGQLVEFDLEDGQVRVRVGANDLGLGPAAVVEDHLDLVCAFHNVIVGEDVAGGTDDDATAQALLGLVALVAEKEAEPRITAARVPFGRLAGVDADHGG